MPRHKSPEPLTRVGIAMFDRDWSRLRSLYPSKGSSAVVRSLIRAHLIRIDKHFAEIEGTLPEIELDLEDISVRTV